MRFTSGISDAVNALEAADAACQQAREQLGGEPCDFACVFASTIYRTSWPALLSHIHGRLQPRVLIGCSGSGIIGGGQELEWVPAISIVAAHLPGVRLFPFAVTPDELEHSCAGGFWVDKIGAAPQANPVFILMADPYSVSPTQLIGELNATYRAAPIVGGLISGGNEPSEHLLFLGTTVAHEGAVGVAMTGNIAMDTVISQGCRPVGRPYVITAAEDNIVVQLGGKQAVAILHEVLSSLSPDDRELAQRGSIFVGLVLNEMKPAFGSGDFLIRNIVGLDPDTGALAVAEPVAVGQTLQFQLRDPASSRQELRRLLQQVAPPPPQSSGSGGAEAPPRPRPAGGLLFNCTGRGKSLYGAAHQDVKLIQTIQGKVPIGGFFCNGEIGPVGGINFVHGYTASLGLFRPTSSG